VDLHAPNAFGAHELRGISLCAGYGGLDLGIHVAERGYRTVGYVEREAHAAATLVARMEDQALAQAPVWDDLKSFDGRPWRDRVHLVSAGYPCQPFSNAGRRLGQADPRHLWPDVARIVDEVGPEWVFCENVEGHIDLGFAEVAGELRDLGYSTKAGLFTAREAGGSHRRRRLFILAHADRFGCRVLSGCDGRTERPDGSKARLHLGGQRRPVLPQQCFEVVDVDVPGGTQLGAEDGTGSEPPIFARGPAELSAWDRLIASRPDLQPAVPRACDGVADRVERTRGAGNGVCPLAAAIAWTTLKSAHLTDLDRGKLTERMAR